MNKPSHLDMAAYCNELLANMGPAKAKPEPNCCHNCLWAGCECRDKSMFKPQELRGLNCAAWTYYD